MVIHMDDAETTLSYDIISNELEILYDILSNELEILYLLD